MVSPDIQIKGVIAAIAILILIISFFLEKHYKISKFLKKLIDFLVDSLRG